jgi:cell shape-determining protein MreC
MRESPRRSWRPLALFVLGLLLLVFHESGYLTPVENALHYVLDPLQRAFSRVIVDVGGVFQTVGQVRELGARVDELQTQVDALTVERVRGRGPTTPRAAELRQRIPDLSSSRC